MRSNLILLTLLLQDHISTTKNGTGKTHKKPFGDKILNLLMDCGPLRPVEIVEHLGIDSPQGKNRLHNRLHFLRRDGFVAKDDSARYRLSSAGRKRILALRLRQEIEEPKKKTGKGKSKEQRIEPKQRKPRRNKSRVDR